VSHLAGMDKDAASSQWKNASFGIFPELQTVSIPGSGRFKGCPNSGSEFQNNGEVVIMSVPVDKIGLVMGKGGKTVKNICHKTGAYCHIIDRSAPRGVKYKDIEIKGSSEAIERVKEMIGEKIRGGDRPYATPPRQCSLVHRLSGPGGPSGPRQRSPAH
jgi:hypothetical protein